MQFFVLKFTIPDVPEYVENRYLAKFRQNTLAPNVNSHMVPSTHLPNSIHNDPSPYNLPRVVPKYTKYPVSC